MKKETESKILDLIKFVRGLETINDREQILVRLNEVLACEMNEQKIGKFDLYDFCDAKEREAYQGVAHINGYKYATDGKMMIKIKADYSEDLEGKAIKKDGSFVPDYVRFPRYDSVIPNVEGWKTIEIDFEKFAESKKMANAHWKVYKKDADYRAIVNIDNKIHLSYWKFEKMLKVAKELGTKTIYYSCHTKPIVIKGEQGVSILMPFLFDEKFSEQHYVYNIHSLE